MGRIVKKGLNRQPCGNYNGCGGLLGKVRFRSFGLPPNSRSFIFLSPSVISISCLSVFLANRAARK